MIKAGDKFEFEDEEWSVTHLINVEGSAIAKNQDGEGGIFSQITIYRSWYNQQKQRTDQLEKQWQEINHYIDRHTQQPTSLVPAYAAHEVQNKLNELELKYTGKIEERK